MDVKLVKDSGYLTGMRLYVDGSHVSDFREMNKKLCGLRCWDFTRGIFNTASLSLGKFEGGIEVNFYYPWDSDWPLDKMEREIKRRVGLVKEATKHQNKDELSFEFNGLEVKLVKSDDPIGFHCWINGEEEISYEYASRKLSNTHYGSEPNELFEEDLHNTEDAYFKRDEERVYVDFKYPFPEALTLEEARDEIIRRVVLINESFSDKEGTDEPDSITFTVKGHEVTIRRTAKGYDYGVEVNVDSRSDMSYYEASRLMSDTQSDLDWGIFVSQGNPYFYRGNDRVEVTFNNTLHKDMSLTEMKVELIYRVGLVEKAFQELEKSKNEIEFTL